MLTFTCSVPPTTATTFDQARALWATSTACQPLNFDGHRWLVELYRQERDQAPPDRAEWFNGKIWEHQIVAAAADAPCYFELPLN